MPYIALTAEQLIIRSIVPIIIIWLIVRHFRAKK